MEFTPSVTCINSEPEKDRILTHDGMCHVGLYLTYVGKRLRGDTLLREVIGLAEGYEDDRDDDIALVRGLFDRLVLNGFFVPLTAEEGAALIRLTDEAQDYWAACGYAEEESQEDSDLGNSHARGLAVCWNQANLKSRKALHVGLREKPHSWVYRRVKEYH